MTTLDFQGHSFRMETDAKIFLEKYLKRIAEYAKKHQIDSEIVEDIYQNILDKLFAMKQPISQKKLISLVNDLGEPADIFEGNETVEFLDKGEKDKKSGIWAKIWSGTKKVCKGFGRCFMMMFVWLWKLIKWMCIGCWLCIKYMGIGLRIGLKWMWKNFFRIVFFFVISLIGFSFFIFCLVCGTAFVGLHNYVLNNVHFFATVPVSLTIGMIIGIVAFAVLTVASGKFAFTGKTFKNWGIIGIGSLLFCLFFSLVGSFQLFQIYGHMNNFRTESRYEIGKNRDIKLNLSTLIDETKMIPFVGIDHLRLENSSGTELRIGFEYKYLGNDVLKNQFERSIVRPKLVEKDGIVSFENLTNFTEWVSFIPIIERIGVIYLPEGAKLEIVGDYFPQIMWVNVLPVEEKYADAMMKYGNFGCVNKEIWRSAKEGRFVCELDGNELEEIKHRYMQDWVMEHFEEFSPITHDDKYKRDYWGNYGIHSDWEFRDVHWENKNSEWRLDVNFADQNVDVDAKLKVIESETGVLVQDFEIRNLWKDEDVWKREYYDKWEV